MNISGILNCHPEVAMFGFLTRRNARRVIAAVNHARVNGKMADMGMQYRLNGLQPYHEQMLANGFYNKLKANLQDLYGISRTLAIATSVWMGLHLRIYRIWPLGPIPRTIKLIKEGTELYDVAMSLPETTPAERKAKAAMLTRAAGHTMEAYGLNMMAVAEVGVSTGQNWARHMCVIAGIPYPILPSRIAKLKQDTGADAPLELVLGMAYDYERAVIAGLGT